LEAFHEFPNEAGEMAIANLNGLLESLRDDLIELGKKVHVDIWVEIVTIDDLRFYEACKYPCDETQLELESCQAAGHHVCGQPFERGGFYLPKETIKLMADVGAQLDFDQYLNTPDGGIPWRNPHIGNL
jgi:hypothetical protein